METSYHLFGSNAADSAMRMVVTNVFQSYMIVMYSSCQLLVTDVCNCDCSLQLMVIVIDSPSFIIVIDHS
jgi:hypothetical protein